MVDEMDTTGVTPVSGISRTRRWLPAIALIALVHAAFFIHYQRPDWQTEWDDQVGYQRLAHVLITTGTFTRYPGEHPFVPETIRTPGYPFFVAAVYTVLGEHHMAVAAAQAVLFAGLCLIVFMLASQLASERVALAAAGMTALFPPFPYYGALVLTELLCTVFVTLGMWSALRAVRSQRALTYAETGCWLGLATLTRPNFVLLPVGLAALVGLLALVRGEWRRAAPWCWTLVFYALVLAPWLAYNSIYVHRFTISPAGGLGRATWEASWQGTWAGRVQADLTRLVEARVQAPDAELDAAVDRFAADNHLPAGPMRTYTHQWRDIRRVWDTPTEPRERAIKRIEADDLYWRAGIDNISHDRLGHVVRRLTIGTLVLWIAEIPIRYSDINHVNPLVVRLIWVAQAILLAVALLGLAFLAARGLLYEAAVLAALLIYVTAVHMPLLAEAMYSLPAKPTVIALAAVALAELGHRVLPQTGDYLP